MEIENIIRYTERAVGLMEIKNINRYSPFAVGLKPSALRGEARLRGRERIMYSKIISPRPGKAKPACMGWSRSISQPPSIADCDHSFTNADGDERKASTCVDARLKAHPISGATSVAAPCSVERRSLFSKRPQHTRRQHPQQRSSAEIE